ncbi:asparagine synthetase B family protein [Methanocalculus sp.]|uniref:asparagine synthetase B family protein n=1 Tax=Methanocalculus sp. TaxID=2004547 RepID=UPI00261B68C4|nr:asparagine synthetase B family protein [Methanocalculus sp.]MDG6249481.1 asparagine synthase-related protein [Methanocalculus sp.]
MNIEIHVDNRYYPWTCGTIDEIGYWFKGTVFYGDELLDGAMIARLISELYNNKHTLEQFLRTLNGTFAFILDLPDRTLVVVDRLRSIPLFYTKTELNLIISDDANFIRELINSPFNECNSVELLVTGYVTGSETLFDGISQLQAGEYLLYDLATENLTTGCYYRFKHENFFKDPEEVLLNRLDEVLVRVFKRLIASTKDQQIVVPLSGGLDSRLIIAMLKRLGVDNVICFSYGSKNWPEAKISRQVSEAVGYPWHYVEYTEDKWYACYHSDMMKEYNTYAGNLTSLPYIQDFLAIKELNDDGKLNDNAVFVPGHTDLFPGVFIPHDYSKDQDYTIEKLLKDIVKQHYHLRQFDGAIDLIPFFKKKILQTFEDIHVHDSESCADALELFALKERTAKLILNGFRAFEFFGFDWRIPLCDAELMDFYSRVPVSNRIKKIFYRKYVGERLFTSEFEALKQIECTTHLGLSLSSSLKSMIKRSETLSDIAIRVARSKQKRMEYEQHRYAMWGIIPEYDYNNLYSRITYINSFLAFAYLEGLFPDLKWKIFPKIILCNKSSSNYD